MIERHPISDRVLKGEVWRYWAPRREPRAPKPEVMEVVRRVEEMEIRAYEERRRKREARWEAERKPGKRADS